MRIVESLIVIESRDQKAIEIVMNVKIFSFCWLYNQQKLVKFIFTPQTWRSNDAPINWVFQCRFNEVETHQLADA